MRFAAFASRNAKELLRDPFSLVSSIGLPVFLLGLISMLQKSIAVDIFRIENFAPGIAVFSFSFISLFSGMLMAKDRSSSFLMRLFASPLSASDYIIGYSLPLLLIALLQSSACFVAALFLGLPLTANVAYAMAALLPAALLFISFGLLLGGIFSDRQVGGIASMLVQLAALSSGMWFDLDMIGGVLKSIGYALPFAHALDAAQAALAGNLSAILPHLAWTAAWTAVIFASAVLVFRKNMKG